MRLLVHADGFRRVVGARVGVDGYIRFGEGGGGGGCKKDGWKEIERERESSIIWVVSRFGKMGPLCCLLLDEDSGEGLMERE